MPQPIDCPPTHYTKPITTHLDQLVDQIKNEIHVLKVASDEAYQQASVLTQRAEIYKKSSVGLENLLDRWASRSPVTAHYQK